MVARQVAVCGPRDCKDIDAERAEEVGRLLAEAGVTVLCGGGRGVMAAVACGATVAGGIVVGIRPDTDREAICDGLSVVIWTGMGEARNSIIIESADAVIVIGGSPGTLSELALANRRGGIPVVQLGGWEVLEDGKPVDLGAVATTPAEAVAAALAGNAATDIDLAELQFQRCDAAGARAHRDLVEDVFRRGYSVEIAAGVAFEDPDAFMARFDAYTSGDTAAGFDLIIATLDGKAVGQTWGWPLGPTARWWEGLQLDNAAADHDTFVAENGRRTFALSEIMVDTAYARRGIGRALHNELLANRTEPRGTLLVDPNNSGPYAAYRSWGWRKVGSLTPHRPHSPTFHVLIRSLST